MTSKPESKIVRDLLRVLNSLPATVADKNYGSAFERRGRPDIVGCVWGIAFVIEVKDDDNVSTPLQTHEQARWKEAHAVVVADATSVRAAILQLHGGLLYYVDTMMGGEFLRHALPLWLERAVEVME